jgi:hypothetical protein
VLRIFIALKNVSLGPGFNTTLGSMASTTEATVNSITCRLIWYNYMERYFILISTVGSRAFITYLLLASLQSKLFLNLVSKDYFYFQLKLKG